MSSPTNVWYCIPSAKNAGDWNTISHWKEKGYRVIVFRNLEAAPLPLADRNFFGKYEGYPKAVNKLIFEILENEPEVDWVVTGGDDIDPSTLPPAEIAMQCRSHFGGTFGVMQPTGDRWMVDSTGRCACERVVESPWIGRDFALSINMGKGPFCEQYFHFFCDEELHNVAKNLGILWHRSDLEQHHHHWSRERRPRPSYLHPAKLNWDSAKNLFQQREREGFPGHQCVETLPL